MVYKATKNVLRKLNEYKLTDKEINEINNSIKLAKSEKGDLGDVLINWKNKDIVVYPNKENEIYLYEFGNEEIPNIEVTYLNGKWNQK